MDFRSEHEMIEFLIKDGFLKTFRTKKEAQIIAKKFGWANSVFKHVRRFETIWIVGQKDTLFKLIKMVWSVA